MIEPKFRNLKNYFKEYCNSTSIHGFRYFGEKRTYIERGWWVIVFLLCLSGCAYVISLVYYKWENSPVIVSLSTKETPIYDIPFPAVTICPEAKSSTSFYSFSENLKKLIAGENLTLEEYKHVLYMNLICKNDITEFLWDQSDYNMSGNDYTNEEFFSYLYKVNKQPPFQIFSCSWMNEDCKDLFQSVITDEGICYTFNVQENKDIYRDNILPLIKPFNLFKEDIEENKTWTLDNGYPEHAEYDTYPLRARFSGVQNALDLYLIDSAENSRYSCRNSMQGYKVSLHTPMRIPRISQQYYKLPLNEMVLTAVYPVMITTSETVKEYKSEKRECYFQNEHPLGYFRSYSQRKCELECLANFTYDLCGCVDFFMPRENNTHICGALNQECMNFAEIVLQLGHLDYKLNKRLKTKKSDLYTAEVPVCDCLPLCTDLSYNLETTSSKWDWKEDFDAETANMSLSRLIIYMQNSQFVTSKRHELYGPTDFLGNFGGLLGLFTGFSILSLMEIIYFLTVRIFCNIRLYGRWSGCEN